jgi:hypothetical protein
MSVKDDYWRYYVEVPYKSPVSKTYKDENGVEHTEYKCAYPIRLIDWDEYSDIAYQLLSISETFLTRRLKLNLDVISLFDYVLLICIEQNLVKDMEKMLSMAFREEIKGVVLTSSESQEVRFVFASDNDFYIDKHNYVAVREILMAQSFYFDPIVGEDERSQKLIDKAIRKKLRGNNRESNMESLVALVRSQIPNINWDTYTYYQLKIDYYTIIRVETFRSIHVYKVMGSDAPVPDFAEILDAHSNPLGQDVLFKKNDRSQTQI